MKVRTHFSAGARLEALIQSWRSKFLCNTACRASKWTLLERTSVSSLSVPAISTSPNQLCRSLRHYSIYQRIAISVPQLYSSNSNREQSRSRRCQSSRALHTSSVCLSSSRGRLVSQKDAEQFIAHLLPAEREVLEKVLVKQKIPEDVGDAERPSWLQLRQLSYQHALPFIAFGFLDNAIMITVGEYIDLTIGITLGISTMAAAGLGNMISDLAGIGLADQVEATCQRLGLPNPRLTPEQMKHSSTRWMALLGRCAGIIIGCMIGMAPLLWFRDPHKHTASGDYEATDK